MSNTLSTMRIQNESHKVLPIYVIKCPIASNSIHELYQNDERTSMQLINCSIFKKTNKHVSHVLLITVCA
jgi:hypothetical protein